MKTSSILLVLVIAVVMMTAGCTSNQPVTTPATTVATPVPTTIVAELDHESEGTGLANPASVYCGQVGGKTEIKKDATGAEYGMCTFPNGSSCEEWALYRGECQPAASGLRVPAWLQMQRLPLTKRFKPDKQDHCGQPDRRCKDGCQQDGCKPDCRHQDGRQQYNY